MCLCLYVNNYRCKVTTKVCPLLTKIKSESKVIHIDSCLPCSKQDFIYLNNIT